MKDGEGETAVELGIEGAVEGDCKSEVAFGLGIEEAEGGYSSSTGMSSVGLSSASYDSVGCIEGRYWLWEDW